MLDNVKPRPVLIAAAYWNYLASSSSFLIGYNANFARALGIKGQADSLAWELFAASVLVFGIGYHWAAADPHGHRDLITLGTIGKPLVFAACVWNFYLGKVPGMFALGSVVDLVFGILFLRFLALSRQRIS
jgi:hypothetical protein